MLYSFNVLLACFPSPHITTYINDLQASTTIPYLIFVLPGLLYYKQQIFYNDGTFCIKNLALVFGIIGIFQIFIYTGLSISTCVWIIP